MSSAPSTPNRPEDRPSAVEPITPHGHRSIEPAAAKPKQDEPKPKDTRSDDELRRDIRASRDELARTLDALEYKLDVPARSREFMANGKDKALRTWDENPVKVAGAGAAALVAVVGGIVGAIVLGRRNR